MRVARLGYGILLGLWSLVAGSAESAWDAPTAPLTKPVEVTVYRSPSCGCCGKWLEHLKKHGFTVKDVKREDMDAVKQQLAVPLELQSCHTAVVEGYFIEGHVPAGDIKKLLLTRPELKGLAVPGMPVGTPGMEMGGRKDAFSVLGLRKDGTVQSFSDYSSY